MPSWRADSPSSRRILRPRQENPTSPGGLLGGRLRQRYARPAQRARHREGHRRRPLAGRRGGDAVRLSSSRNYVDRLILVGAGGVTKDVNIALRFAALPAGAEALALLRLPLVLPALQVIGHLLGAVVGSTGVGRDIPNALRILADLPEPTASAASTRTLRAVVDWQGQVVTMLDRCYLTESVPVQLIWGEQDVVIPVSHAHMAHAAMPGSRLEIFPKSGHFPFHDDPDRFIDLVEDHRLGPPPTGPGRIAGTAAQRQYRERGFRVR